MIKKLWNKLSDFGNNHYHAEDDTCGFYDCLDMGIDNARHMCQHVECMVGCYVTQDDYHQMSFAVGHWQGADNMNIQSIPREFV